MRRILRVGVACFALAIPAAGHAATLNPVSYHGRPMSCPDPDVFNYGRLYVAACTSDFGQDNPLPGGGLGRDAAAFPLYVSSDLKRWRFVNYVITPGRSPRQAIPATGNWPGGEYWAPEIHRIGRYWVAYYGAQLRDPPGRMAIFVSWTEHLFGGRWRSKLLYTDNSGNIDPSVAWVGGHLEMVAAQQASLLWTARLTEDGLKVISPKRYIARSSLPWEGTCVEGPVIWDYHGHVFVFYNANSTWNDSYAIGVLALKDGRWRKRPKPLLQSGRNLVSTGIGAQPFMRNGQLMLAFHVQLGHATHNMEGRWLAFARLHLDGTLTPYIAHSIPPRTFSRRNTYHTNESVGNPPR